MNGHVRTTAGIGIIHSGENCLVAGDFDTWSKSSAKRVCVWAHGATGTAASSFENDIQREMILKLAAHFTVVVADLGFDVYGNDTHISRVASAIAHGRSAWGASTTLDPVLYGESMGAAGVLNYTKANPSSVQAVACAIPALDPQDAVTNNRGGLASAINAAYPPLGYSDLLFGADHSPVVYASGLPNQAALPIRLWTSSNDTLTVPATADEFMTERPSTVRTNMGAVGHDKDSTEGYADQIVQFLVDACPEL